MIAESLPHFAFFVDPFKDDAFERSEEACACCGKPRGWRATCGIYSEADPDTICPWCVADGSAARKFRGHFNTLETVDGLSQEHAKAITERTPLPLTWQDFDWPCADGEPCVYLGHVRGDVLFEENDAAKIAACREAVAAFYEDEAEAQDRLAACAPGDNMGVYVFRTRAGAYRILVDFD
ncbi:MAG TPA: hypothetical protein DCZ49_08600 [Hyphomonadaceae bacterium]|nr:hypothetical protein [Hyphomonadaceae bacterium]